MVPGPISPGQARSVYWSTSIAVLKLPGPESATSLSVSRISSQSPSAPAAGPGGPDAVGRYYSPVTFTPRGASPGPGRCRTGTDRPCPWQPRMRPRCLLGRGRAQGALDLPGLRVPRARPASPSECLPPEGAHPSPSARPICSRATSPWTRRCTSRRPGAGQPRCGPPTRPPAWAEHHRSAMWTLPRAGGRHKGWR